MRKSPIEHTVHRYKRQTGTVVNDYLRGSGEAKVVVKTPKLSGKVLGKKVNGTDKGGFNMLIKYADDNTKEVILKEKTYLTALPVGIGYADRQIRRITLRKV
jgi:hypothetical protein